MRPVPSGCLHRLTKADLFFVSATLALSDASGRSLARLFDDDGALESILAHPKLIAALLDTEAMLDVSPELYFYVLVRHTLGELGLDDPQVADYVAAALAEYGRAHPLTRLPATPESEFTYHVDFLKALDYANNYERFYVYVFSANQFLVLTGLFPHFLEYRERRRGAPGLSYYEDVARGAFESASQHPLADEFALREVFARLVETMPTTRRALNRLADEYLVLAS